MKDFAKSIRTGNALSRGQVLYTRGNKKFVYGGEVNGTHIVYRQPDGKTFSFSSEEGVKQFIKDIPVYESAYVGNSKVGNEDNSDIIRAAKKQLEDAKKFGWAETGYNGWTKKDVEDLEKKIKELEQKQKTGNSSHTKEEAKTKDEYFKILKFYQTQGYRTKAGEYNTNGRIKLHKGDDSVEIVLVGNSKVGNSKKTFSGKYIDIYDDGQVIIKDGWAFGERFNENNFRGWIAEQIRLQEHTLQTSKQMRSEFEKNI